MCDSGYGRKADRKCYACSNQCTKCSEKEIGGKTVFQCDTCLDGFRKNSDQCSECPKNCVKCSVSEGSISCTSCKQYYALYGSTNKLCAACPANCDVCTATAADKASCSTCKKGFTLKNGACEGKSIFF